jgi:threonine/homoserine/homoserine lactone efflux protein
MELFTNAGHLWLFAALVFGIIALPGMDMAFVMASTLADGRSSGFAAIAGIVAGGVVHVAAGTVGIGLLLQHSPLAFDLLLAGGSLYVAWMGIGLMRSRAALERVADAPSRPIARTFSRALATCLLNPKAYVFMLAVFPQFIVPRAGAVAAQAAVLGAIISTTQIVVYGAVAQCSSALRDRLRASASGQAAFGKVVGLMLLAAALLTLGTGLHTTSWRLHWDAAPGPMIEKVADVASVDPPGAS